MTSLDDLMNENFENQNKELVEDKNKKKIPARSAISSLDELLLKEDQPVTSTPKVLTAEEILTSEQKRKQRIANELNLKASRKGFDSALIPDNQDVRRVRTRPRIRSNDPNQIPLPEFEAVPNFSKKEEFDLVDKDLKQKRVLYGQSDVFTRHAQLMQDVLSGENPKEVPKHIREYWRRNFKSDNGIIKNLEITGRQFLNQAEGRVDIDQEQTDPAFSSDPIDTLPPDHPLFAQKQARTSLYIGMLENIDPEMVERARKITESDDPTIGLGNVWDLPESRYKVFREAMRIMMKPRGKKGSFLLKSERSLQEGTEGVAEGVVEFPAFLGFALGEDIRYEEAANRRNEIRSLIRGRYPIEGEGGTSGFIAEMFYDFFQMAPAMYTSAGIGKLASVAGASTKLSSILQTGFWTTMIAPERYLKLKDMEIGSKTALAVSLLTSVPEAMIETWQTKRMLGAIDSDLVKKAMQKSLSRFIAGEGVRLMKGSGEQIWEEVLQAGIDVATLTFARAIKEQGFDPEEFGKLIKEKKIELTHAAKGLVLGQLIHQTPKSGSLAYARKYGTFFTQRQEAKRAIFERDKFAQAVLDDGSVPIENRVSLAMAIWNKSNEIAVENGLPDMSGSNADDIVTALQSSAVDQPKVTLREDDTDKSILREGLPSEVGRDVAIDPLKREGLPSEAGVQDSLETKQSSGLGGNLRTEAKARKNIQFRKGYRADRSIAQDKIIPGTENINGTEGLGLYVSHTRKFAERFGDDISEIDYREPSNPLIVDNERLFLLNEADELFDPIKPNDSEWLKLNKQATINSGVSDETWNSGKVAEELTKLIKSSGYDAVRVTQGSDRWDVLLDESLYSTPSTDLRTELMVRGEHGTAFGPGEEPFEQFDNAKFRSGEGAMAFGAGHYFTDAEAHGDRLSSIARGYAEALKRTKKTSKFSIKGVPFSKPSGVFDFDSDNPQDFITNADPVELAKNELWNEGDIDAAIDGLKNQSVIVYDQTVGVEENLLDKASKIYEKASEWLKDNREDISNQSRILFDGKPFISFHITPGISYAKELSSEQRAKNYIKKYNSIESSLNELDTKLGILDKRISNKPDDSIEQKVTDKADLKIVKWLKDTRKWLEANRDRFTIPSQPRGSVIRAELWKDHDEVLLDWYEPVGSSIINKLSEGEADTHRKRFLVEISKLHNEYQKVAQGSDPRKSQELESIKKRADRIRRAVDTNAYVGAVKFVATVPTGQELYKFVERVLESDIEASNFLLGQGIDGIRYPAGTLSGKDPKRSNPRYNYVVFDGNAVTITGHTFLQNRIPTDDTTIRIERKRTGITVNFNDKDANRVAGLTESDSEQLLEYLKTKTKGDLPISREELTAELAKAAFVGSARLENIENQVNPLAIELSDPRNEHIFKGVPDPKTSTLTSNVAQDLSGTPVLTDQQLKDFGVLARDVTNSIKEIVERVRNEVMDSGAVFLGWQMASSYYGAWQGPDWFKGLKDLDPGAFVLNPFLRFAGGNANVNKTQVARVYLENTVHEMLHDQKLSHKTEAQDLVFQLKFDGIINNMKSTGLYSELLSGLEKSMSNEYLQGWKDLTKRMSGTMVHDYLNPNKAFELKKSDGISDLIHDQMNRRIKYLKGRMMRGDTDALKASSRQELRDLQRAIRKTGEGEKLTGPELKAYQNGLKHNIPPATKSPSRPSKPVEHDLNTGPKPPTDIVLASWYKNPLDFTKPEGIIKRLNKAWMGVLNNPLTSMVFKGKIVRGILGDHVYNAIIKAVHTKEAKVQGVFNLRHLTVLQGQTYEALGEYVDKFLKKLPPDQRQSLNLTRGKPNTEVGKGLRQRAIANLDPQMRRVMIAFQAMADDIYNTIGQEVRRAEKEISKEYKRLERKAESLEKRIQKEKSPKIRIQLQEQLDFVNKRLDQPAPGEGKGLNYFENYFFGYWKHGQHAKRTIQDLRRKEGSREIYGLTDENFMEKTIHSPADVHNIFIRDSEGEIMVDKDGVKMRMELADENPFHNLQREYGILTHYKAMYDLLKELEQDPNVAVTLDKANGDQRENWKAIGHGGELIFGNHLFHPDAADLLNNLLRNNWWSRGSGRRIVRDAFGFSRGLKFAVGSLWHLRSVTASAIADVPWFQNPLIAAKEIRERIIPFTFKPWKGNIADQEIYEDFLLHGGGAKDSNEKQAMDVFEKALVGWKFKYGGFWPRVVTKIPRAITTKLFTDVIPYLKFVSYRQEVDRYIRKNGHEPDSTRKIQIIKESQNIYGEMNERLWGLSPSVSSLGRIIGSAPGYGIGNFLTDFAAAFNLGGKGWRTGQRSRRQIFQGLVLTGIMIYLAEWWINGEPKDLPETLWDAEDMFKVKVKGAKDVNGNQLYINMMTQDRDHWKMFFEPGIIAYKEGIPEGLNNALDHVTSRLGSMTHPLFLVSGDVAGLMTGKAVLDYKGDRVYNVSDPRLEKMGKFFTHEANRLQPIGLAQGRKVADKKALNNGYVLFTALGGGRIAYGSKDYHYWDLGRTVGDLNKRGRDVINGLVDDDINTQEENVKFHNKVVESTFSHSLLQSEQGRARVGYRKEDLLINLPELDQAKILDLVSMKIRQSSYRTNPSEARELGKRIDRRSRWLNARGHDTVVKRDGLYQRALANNKRKQQVSSLMSTKTPTLLKIEHARTGAVTK